ncbi:MAG: hypothetical protein HRT55_07470 [Colwellia sp.]|uniref:hypothetical protein n=1 Tax=Colwellia sp. TaxID=56799 RepID=UPI0025C2254B|nr:hypothetical protein [Colwellia sp.]NQZ26139.1 hypothetical protein [Colwellia sp.]
MTMQITSSTASFKQIQPVSSARPHGESHSDLSDILTPEQKNTLQQGADDKIAEQVENVKSNYQTAKDVDLMQSYYQQQQKLFDIYLQESTNSDVQSNNSTNINAVSTLTDTYAALYELHQEVKEGIGQIPDHELPSILPMESASKVAEVSNNAFNQSLANKQMDAYNSLMMPSTASYVHLSA